MLSARLNTPDEGWRPASGAGGFRGARGKSLLFFLSVFQGLRSGGGGAKMVFEIPILLGEPLP